ncbi:MAG: hypothetical protein RIF33_17345 [Cyclobacteriaceae bacterium]
MLRKVMLGLAIILLVSCQEEAEEPSVSIVGDWEVSIFQVLSIEGADVLESKTLQDIGQFTLNEEGTGTATFKTFEPFGFTTSQLKWSLKDDVVALVFSSIDVRTFEINLSVDQNHLALTEMITEEETDQRPHQFQMTTIQLTRR